MSFVSKKIGALRLGQLFIAGPHIIRLCVPVSVCV